MKRKLWAKSMVAAAVATTLVACGGGSGSDGGFPLLPIAPPPAPETVPEPPAPQPPAPAPQPPAPPPASSTSSGTCLNEADWHAGTEKEEEIRVVDQNGTATTFTQKRITGEREAFAGVNPVPQRYPSSIDGIANVGTVYSDLAATDHVVYGASNVTTTPLGETSSSSTVYDPPLITPIDMQPGQTVEHSYTAKTTATGNDGSQAYSEAVVKIKNTYIGRETVQTALGTFGNACKFVGFNPGSAAENDEFTTTSWIASDGPYRGQVMKSEVRDAAGTVTRTSEAIRMTYTPK